MKLRVPESGRSPACRGFNVAFEPTKAIWEFGVTPDEVGSFVDSKDSLGGVLRAHLAVESVLGAALSTQILNAGALDEMRLTFANKVQLAVALGIVSPHERSEFMALNRLRNKLAHDYHYAVTLEDCEILIAAMPTEMRNSDAVQEYVSKGTVRDLLFVSLLVALVLANFAVERALAEKAGMHRLTATIRVPYSGEAIPAFETLVEEISREISTRCPFSKSSSGVEGYMWRLGNLFARIRPGKARTSEQDELVHLIVGRDGSQPRYDAHYLKEPRVTETLATRIAKHLRCPGQNEFGEASVATSSEPAQASNPPPQS